MHFSQSSKVLIGIILVFTVASVVIVGRLETHYASEAVKMQQASAKHNEAIINSLTNMTQNVSFSKEEPAMIYTGYIMGAGYSAYQFRATQDQTLRVNLKGDDFLDIVLFGPETKILERDTDFIIPVEGLYELRVMFKENMEIQQEKAALDNIAQAVPYTITLTLK
ncbi:hypothetical protein GCM10011450_04360 [Advenella faeciporci]|uniref:Uncharacterized protein n=1 Tax=Advenella faeciporci TaxID=797535 RepID=A0A918JG97_9BURK|nr:hypothetical protein [Advenella faeciporci]NLY34378.1 hypothetical protein [Alcaligenaceae bacterium]GGW77684.1 hypothetical protein GCM10011450_04360 [Advenella faeciporci]